MFRYALERWKADTYEMKLRFDQLAPKLEKKLIQVAGESEKAHPSLNLSLEMEIVDELEQPKYELFSPQNAASQLKIMSGSLSEKVLDEVVASPVREKIVEKILSGESAVWLLVLSGDDAKDEKARELLKRSLKAASNSISLPEGIKGKGHEAKSEEEKENTLTSEIPLKIAFSIIELNPEDAREQALVRMIFAGKGEGFYKGKVMVAPVFGRGRTTGPVDMADLTEDKILQACQFLCGACSCGVKEQNPGFDLLLAVDWHEKVAQSQVIIEKPLADMSSFASDIAKDETAAETMQQTEPSIEQAENLTDDKNSGLLLYAIAGLLIVVGLGSAYILKRGNE